MMLLAIDLCGAQWSLYYVAAFVGRGNLSRRPSAKLHTGPAPVPAVHFTDVADHVHPAAVSGALREVRSDRRIPAYHLRAAGVGDDWVSDELGEGERKVGYLSRAEPRKASPLGAGFR